MALLKVTDLKIHFPIKAGILRRTVGHTKAVDGVSISIDEGTTYGLVGESGSGKSTTGRGIIGLNDITEGTVEFDGHDITKKGRNTYNYKKDIQMVFQDPYSSLNSKKRVNDIIAEPLRNFSKLTKQQERDAVIELLQKVGLSADNLYKYPHEFSGGQRQRIGIARAIALNPKLIIADEPVSALDVSVQAQVLNFMQKIQRELKLSYLFISHDLGIIHHVCDKIGIMYKGRLVEEGTPEDIFNNPQHIYTQRLVSAIPDINPQNRESKRELRTKISKEYTDKRENYFDKDGLAFQIKTYLRNASCRITGEGVN